MGANSWDSYTRRASIEEPTYKPRNSKVDESKLHNYTKATNEIKAKDIGYIAREKLERIENERRLQKILGIDTQIHNERTVRTNTQYGTTVTTQNDFGTRGNGNASVGRKLTDAQCGLANKKN